MKKIICIFLFMFCFLFLSNVSFAKNYDNKTINIEGSLLKLEKQKNRTYNLVLYDSNGYYKGSTFNYKINKRNIDGKTIYIAQNEYNIIFYSPDNLVSEILPKYYDAFDNIKFINYPNIGTIKFTIKSKKFSDTFYTLASINQHYIILKKIDKERPRLYDDNFNDSNSNIYKLLNISYEKFPVTSDYFYHEEIFPAFIDEEVKIENNKIYITYKDISFQKHYNLKDYPNLKKKKEKISNNDIFIDNFIDKIENIQELYDYIEKETIYKFVNYPQNFILAQWLPDFKSELIFFENGKKIKNVQTEYRSFYFPDKEIFMNKVCSFSRHWGISYQNPNRIIAQDKNRKWGIIDKDNNVKVPFVYDKIIPIGNNVNEKIVNIDDEQAEQLIVKYMGQSKEYNMFFVYKDNKIGVINDNNEILVGFEPLKIFSDIDESMINKSILKDVQKAKLALRSGNIIKILTIPLWLPFFVLAVSSII